MSVFTQSKRSLVFMLRGVNVLCNGYLVRYRVPGFSVTCWCGGTLHSAVLNVVLAEFSDVRSLSKESR